MLFRGEEVAATCDLALLEASVGDLRDINSREVHLCASRNGVSLVDALNGHAIDLARTGHKEESRWQLSKEDDALAAESAGEQDQNRAWNDALSELGGISLLSSHLSLLVVSGIPRSSFDH